MRKSNELLIIVEDIAPSLKSSEKLFIVGVIMEESLAAFKECGDMVMNKLTELSEEAEDETFDEELEERDTYVEEYDKASSNAGELI